ncbi:MAG: hypothetical protein HYS13_04760 [Planctomycetia bacterium]|nr:hypothetical protein [Planctomycetia bacterium]
MESSSPISFSLVEFVALLGAGALVLFLLTRSRRFVGAALFGLFMVLTVSGLFFRMVKVGGGDAPSAGPKFSISYGGMESKTTIRQRGRAARLSAGTPKSPNETAVKTGLAASPTTAAATAASDEAIEAPALRDQPTSSAPTSQPSVGNLTVSPSGTDSQGNGPTPPEWVKRGDDRVGTTDIHVLDSGPHVSQAEALQELRRRAVAYAEDYFEEVLTPSPQRHFDVEPAFVEKAILKETWQTTTQRTPAGEVEEMVVVFGRLEFDQPTKGYLQQRWEATLATQQLLQIGLVVALVLTLVGTLYAYFRLDTATKGYYTWRLRLAAFGIAVAACICAAGLGEQLARTSGWMTVGAEYGPSDLNEHIH